LVSADGWVSSKIVIVGAEIGGAIVAHPDATRALAHSESKATVYMVLNAIEGAARVTHLITSIY